MTITPVDTCGIVHLSGEKYRSVYECNDPLIRALIENYRVWAKYSPESEQRSSTLNYDYGLDLSELALELDLPTPTTIGDANVLLSELGLELSQRTPATIWDACVELSELGMELELLEPLLAFWARQTKNTATWTNDSQSTAPSWTNLEKK